MPPPTGKTAQESLDSMKQALLAYMHCITPNILTPDLKFHCDLNSLKLAIQVIRRSDHGSKGTGLA